MTRPILWATGALVAIALSGSMAGTRLAGLSGWAKPAQPTTRAIETPPAAGGDRLLVVNSDLQGHYLVHPEVEGRRVRMMVDTGATIVALTEQDAAAAGYRPLPADYKRRISTANGSVGVAPIRIREMRLGDIIVRDVEAVVVPAGRLGMSLLGMSFLRQLRGFDISGGRLTLRG